MSFDGFYNQQSFCYLETEETTKLTTTKPDKLNIYDIMHNFYYLMAMKSITHAMLQLMYILTIKYP